MKPTIEQFVALVNKGIEAWKEAGRLLVVMMRADPGICDRIIKSHPSITPEMLLAFEQIGNGNLDPRLLLIPNEAARLAMSLPPELQQQVLERGVEVLVSRQRGKRDVVRTIPLSKMTAQQARMAISERWIIPAEAQVLPKKSSERGLRYRIEGDEIFFIRGCLMKKHQLERLLLNWRDTEP